MSDKSKFQKWYNEYREFNYDAVHAPMESKIAWEACKNEVLKIINDPDNRYWHPVKKEIVDQIENL